MVRDQLAEYLDSLSREDSYRVDETLKESAFEITERVSFVGANGAARGPFIRKRIKHDAGIGSVYERIFNAQQQGQRFKHIPAIFECYPNDEGLVVIMEFAHGETLQELVYREDPSEDLARRVFPMLCDAVSELHEDFQPSIIHRDLKPSNVMVSDSGLTIIDFGIARQYREGAHEDTSHFGTRSFAPPEQFGFGQTTVRSDVYALGMLLFFCLTEKIPDASTMKRELDDDKIPADLQVVIAKATAFDPSYRYASAREFKQAFLQAVGERSAIAVDSAATTTGATAAVEGAPSIPIGAAATTTGATATTTPGGIAIAPADAPSEASAMTGIGPGASPRAEFSAPPEPPAETSRFRVLGIVWDVLLVGVEIILLIACVSTFVNPSSSVVNYPTWLLAVSYLVLMPLFFLACGLLISDKRPIKRLVPATRNLRAGHWIVAFAVTIVALFICFGIAGMLYPLPTT